MSTRHTGFLRSLVVIVVAAATTVLTSGEQASACSCAVQTEEAAFETADAVFVGQLVGVRTPPGDTWSSMDPERFVFDVSEVFKGEVSARQSVVTARDGASCGLELSVGGTYVMFATATSREWELEPGEVVSGLCNGNRAVSDAPIPASFGAPSTPSAAPATTAPPPASPAPSAPSNVPSTVAAATGPADDPGASSSGRGAVLGAVVAGTVVVVLAAAGVARRRARVATSR